MWRNNTKNAYTSLVITCSKWPPHTRDADCFLSEPETWVKALGGLECCEREMYSLACLGTSINITGNHRSLSLSFNGRHL